MVSINIELQVTKHDTRLHYIMPAIPILILFPQEGIEYTTALLLIPIWICNQGVTPTQIYFFEMLLKIKITFFMKTPAIAWIQITDLLTAEQKWRPSDPCVSQKLIEFK